MNRALIFAPTAAALLAGCAGSASLTAPHAAKGVEPLPGGSTTAPSDGVHTNGQGPTTSTVTATSSPPDTAPVTIVPFELPETPTTQTDQQWWQGQPGYDGSLPLPPDWISQRESHDDYAAVNPAGAYGKWQFLQSTWNATAAQAGRPDLIGVRPDQASPADQDAMAADLWDYGAGCSAWSAC